MFGVSVELRTPVRLPHPHLLGETLVGAVDDLDEVCLYGAPFTVLRSKADDEGHKTLWLWDVVDGEFCCTFGPRCGVLVTTPAAEVSDV